MSNLRDAHFTRLSVLPPKPSPLRHYVSTSEKGTSPSSVPFTDAVVVELPHIVQPRGLPRPRFALGRRLNRFGIPIRPRVKRNRPPLPLRIWTVRRNAWRSKYANSDDEDYNGRSRERAATRSNSSGDHKVADEREDANAGSIHGGQVPDSSNAMAIDECDESDVETSYKDDSMAGVATGLSLGMDMIEVWLRTDQFMPAVPDTTTEPGSHQFVEALATSVQHGRDDVPGDEEASERGRSEDWEFVAIRASHASPEQTARRRIAPIVQMRHMG